MKENFDRWFFSRIFLIYTKTNWFITSLVGTENGLTLGTPIGLLIPNQDVKKADYDPFKDIPRPGHADYTYLMKYGVKAESGGGMS